ncbi:right-handed parallel beta-helix repeat-containing protein [Synechocystis salina]|uniref:right-handed parallel beta-helix repeat-containing protein n=1 Tax=Synechocystis salina TaxID=945780 RepID=UPI0039083E41
MKNAIFGCGTVGLDLNNVERFNFIESTIKECTYSIMHITNSSDVMFIDSIFKDTEQFDLIEIDSSSAIKIDNCIISSNSTGDFQPHLFKLVGSCSDIQVLFTTIKHNEIPILVNNKSLIEFIDCDFKGNDFIRSNI